jgi:DNA repair exonuclease SbcCD ATPase subunit
MPKQEKPGKKALEKMREKNKELLEKNKELLENLNSLQSILQNKEKEIQSLKDLVDTLTFKENEMKNSIKQLKRQEIELKNEISKLKLEVAELEPLKKQKTPVPRGKYQREASPKSPNPFEIKKFDFERLRIPEKLSASPPLTTRHDKSSKWVCHEIMKMLAVNSLEELIPRLSHLKAHHSKLKKDKQIVEMIAKMMVQCSPEGTFQSSPSCKQIWKWITRLLEEYMKLKQSLEGELIYKLKDMLKVKEMDQMIDVLKALLYKLN